MARRAKTRIKSDSNLYLMSYSYIVTIKTKLKILYIVFVFTKEFYIVVPEGQGFGGKYKDRLRAKIHF